MNIEKRFEQALSCPNPVEALRSLVFDFSAEGYDKSAILEIFEKQRQRLRSADRELDEDAVMDVMDFLVGWCSPRAKLLSDEAEASTSNIGIKTPPVQATVL
jgi:hypothetical protein